MMRAPHCMLGGLLRVPHAPMLLRLCALQLRAPEWQARRRRPVGLWPCAPAAQLLHLHWPVNVLQLCWKLQALALFVLGQS